MFKTIIVATDGSDHADKAVAVAGDLAAKYDAEVTLLHVLLRRSAADEDLSRLMGLKTVPEETRSAFAEHAAAQHKTGIAGGEFGSFSVPVPPHILAAVGNAVVDNAESIARDHGATKVARQIAEGDPAKVILGCAKEKNADLIVMGTRGLSDLQGLFVGSVSHKVSHVAECTCITVR